MDIGKKLNAKLNSLLTEEFNSGDNVIYGYHCTSLENVESISENGFRVGGGAMEGKGFYSFYNFEDAMTYAFKGEIQNPVIVKFEINTFSRLMILNMDVAKEILGDEYHLKNQIERYFKYHGGYEGFITQASTYFKGGKKDVLDSLAKIETDNSEKNQVMFWSYMLSADDNGKLNVIYNGTYGIHIRLGNPVLATPLGYYQIDSDGKKNYHPLKKLIKIPDSADYDMIRDNIGGLVERDELIRYKKAIVTKLGSVRNNREYDLYSNILTLLEKIKI